MRSFDPIAIVGLSSIFPGAFTPESFSSHLRRGRDMLRDVPRGRWRMDERLAHCEEGIDGTWSDRGGYVEGFDALFEPEAYTKLASSLVTSLDELFQWVLYTGQQAYTQAGFEPGQVQRAGVILGNLSFPSESMVQWAERQWLEQLGPDFIKAIPEVDPHNRFTSGLPAQLLAHSLGFSGPSCSIDAACASSLYAIKLACLELQQRRADVMIAAAAQRADNLFLHVGFCALQAMSKTGQSRPFHQGADGLVPAEGAASVVLMRLEDALKGHHTIHGVIRGVGLSNDGRGKGLLAPSTSGQQRAMLAAFEESGLRPSQIDYVECHATGTVLGDRIELESMASVYGQERLKIGSHKSNMGHAITAAGMAGLIKVLGCMEQGQLAPTLHLDDEADVTPDALARFKVIRSLEAWEPSGKDGVRRAAVSAFGFGGNNAHLLLEQHDVRQDAVLIALDAPTAPEPEPELVIVGMQVRCGQANDLEAFAQAVFDGEPLERRAQLVTMPIKGLRFPPKDLEQALPQQWMILEAARALSDELELDAQETAVLIGMQCDTSICRYGARWRLLDWATLFYEDLDDQWLHDAQDELIPMLQAQGVVGTMPNVPANRINSQLDLGSPGFTISSERSSMLDALRTAQALLTQGSVKAAIVGAVELGSDALHERAALAINPQAADGLDAAVVFLVTTQAYASERGWTPRAKLHRLEPDDTRQALDLTKTLGDAHSAQAALELAAATLSVQYGRELDAHLGDIKIAASPRYGQPQAWLVQPAQAEPSPWPWVTPLHKAALMATDRDALAQAIGQDKLEGTSGQGRLARLSAITSAPTLAEHQRRVMARLERPGPGRHDQIWLFDEPLQGQLGWLWTGSIASSSPLPDRSGLLPSAASHETLLASHLALTFETLGLSPDHVWTNTPGQLIDELGLWEGAADEVSFAQALERSELLSRDIGGSFDALRRYWFMQGHRREAMHPGPIWASTRIFGPVEELDGLLRDAGPLVELTQLHTAHEATIAGFPEALERLLSTTLAHFSHQPLTYPALAIHSSSCEYISGLWSGLHRRALGQSPSWALWVAESIVPWQPNQLASMVGAALRRTWNFKALIERWYEQGVRRFVVAGPVAEAAGWIDEILGARPHVAVALPTSPQALRQASLDAAAGLWASGLDVPYPSLLSRYAPTITPIPAQEVGPQLKQPAHRPWPALSTPAPVSRETNDPKTIEAAPSVAPAAPIQPQPKPQPRPKPRPPVQLRPVPVQPPSAPPTKLLEPADEQERQAQLETLLESWREPMIPSQPLALLTQEIERQKAALHRTLDAQREVIQALVEKFEETEQEFNATSGGSLSQPVENVVGNPSYPGISLTRQQLEYLSSGQISQVFGPMFKPQDGFKLQTRMPQPPLLLCDRVLGIDAEPGSMTQGRIWTETDITPNAWYLHQGRMPAGVMIEAGQADLLLASYLGVDLHHRGERAYRLLGCELTYHGPLPTVGETLHYDIKIDGFAQQGEVRLFFFHYDCTVDGQLRLSVRGGQAGFFTEQELESSSGVLWSPESTGPVVAPMHSRPRSEAVPSQLTRAQLEANASARARSPRLPQGKLLLLDRVTVIDADGGPWGRGYLRAEVDISPSDWFFEGHFYNDPCMPGTLMFEASLQTMQVYLTAMGMTVDAEQAHFMPVTQLTYTMRCRGQITPSSRLVTYELFVQELIDGPEPTLYADLLVTVDGLKAFHAHRMGLTLKRS